MHASEQTRKHCMILENCCYGYNETLILRMIHAGLFGELLYGEGAYIHDLREELFSNAGEGLWRRTEHTLRNGNLYPTHGLGPVANYMGIQRGDRFAYMVSMSSPQRGLDALPQGPSRARRSALGRALHLRRHEHLAHQDREGAHHHRQARRLNAASLRPHQPHRRHQGRCSRTIRRASTSTA